jgi:GNAT superfamily N-acetyltransferase
LNVLYRPLGPGDLEHVKRALYAAVSWDPRRDVPPLEVTIEHAELARYHRDWGRRGDAGVAAEADGAVVGVAFYRRFTDEDHGHGYVDAETPELAVAVEAAHRGSGIGTRLLADLADLARRDGASRLSLSVDADNPALRLYERLGYVELSRDEGGVRMLLEL